MSHSPQDDDEHKHKPKKKLVLQPLHEDELRAHASKKHARNDSGIFAELATKTAELADQVKGQDTPKTRILELEGPDPFAELHAPDSKIQPILLETEPQPSSDDPAVNLIRQKLQKIHQHLPYLEFGFAGRRLY